MSPISYQSSIHEHSNKGFSKIYDQMNYPLTNQGEISDLEVQTRYMQKKIQIHSKLYQGHKVMK